MSETVVLRGCVLTPESETSAVSHDPGFVAIGRDGKIERVGRIEELPEGRLVDLGSALILPSFVDAHVHLPQIDVRGRFGLPLLPWLERFVFPAEQAFEDPDHAAAVAERFFSALAAAGTGCAGVFSTSHTEATHRAFEVAAASGLRVVMGKVLMDRNGPSPLLEPPETAIPATLALAERWEGAAGGRLHTAITPRFVPTSSPELLREAGRVARDAGLRVQTHLSENVDEIAAVRDAFPEHGDYLSVYESAELVTDRSVFAHAVHCERDAFERLARSGAAVAACPTSNAFLGSGSFPAGIAREAGVTIGLGSDVGAGPVFSLLDVLRHFAYLDRAEPAELLYRGTLAGARALSLESTGRLEPGASADIVVLEPPPDVTGTPLERFSQCVFRSAETRVRATLVEGRPVFGDL